MKHKVIQGDNFWLDITGDITTEDSNWTNWEGEWAIVTALGTLPVASDSLLKTATVGKFRLQVSPVITDGLAVGDYKLIAQVRNDTIQFRKEVLQDTFQILAQGITPP
jgi:hypothetical protein